MLLVYSFVEQQFPPKQGTKSWQVNDNAYEVTGRFTPKSIFNLNM